jgi:hypothetical protein
VDGEIRVAILFRLVDREVLERDGMLIERVLAVGVLLVVMDLLDVVVCLFLMELFTFRDPVEDGLRTTGVPTDRRVLIDPRKRLEEVRDWEIVDRFGVLRLDVIDRLGVELRVDILGMLLRVDVLGVTDRLGVRETAEREGAREAAALRLLLLEFLLCRELLAAKTGSPNKATKQIMEKTIKDRLSLPFFCLLFSFF